MVYVHKLCDLDLDLYSCVSPRILTTEVVITEERIAHIQAHHPQDYERFSACIPATIQDPDYILADTRPNTAMLLKQVTQCGAHFRLALRIVTPQDRDGYKNSVLTFMKIREKEWRRLLRNKKILYKRE